MTCIESPVAVCTNPLQSTTSAQQTAEGDTATAGFLSLLELTARNITANKVPWRKQSLPVSLKGILCDNYI